MRLTDESCIVCLYIGCGRVYLACFRALRDFRCMNCSFDCPTSVTWRQRGYGLATPFMSPRYAIIQHHVGFSFRDSAAMT